MPKPRLSTYPKEQRWRFVQRNIKNHELLKFAENIVKCHNKKIDDVLPELLSFLPSEQRTKGKWLDLWVNILHQMGLGYTWNEGKNLYATELSVFIKETQDIKSYYHYWALKFQFPFGYPKHKTYVDKRIAVQPVVLIMQYLVQLNKLTKKISDSYLTKDEIVKFLMKSKDHSDILKNSNSIISLRKNNYNYSKEEQLNPGFFEAGDHLMSRGKLFIENIDLIKFSGNKIIVKDENHLQSIIKFLSFAKNPTIFLENTQDIRNNFLSSAFNNLDPYPSDLLTISGIEQSKVKRKVSKKWKITPQKLLIPQQITNPTNTAGSFSTTLRPSRKFQSSLRRDILVMYNNKCCVCGLDDQLFLRAAHIVPVEIDPSIAADRSNCLLMCVIHDIAFENGLIFLDDRYKVQINNNISAKIKHSILKSELINRLNQKIRLPTSLKPKIEFLDRHKKLHGIF